MQIDFSGLFHRSSKDLTAGGTHFVTQDDSQWPDEWKTVYYKTYELDKIPLDKIAVSAEIFETIRMRHSQRDFSKRPLSVSDIGTLLRYSCGIVNEKNGVKARAQPSGGARYPIEIYPIFFTDGEVPAGTYHYDVKNHALDVLSQRAFSPEDIAGLISYEFARDASCAIIMTGVFSRTQSKYGERGYRYILLEAGHIGQNLYLVSGALGIKCCAMAGTRDTALETLLDVDGMTESVVYGLLLG
jgi:SagB-type dehydrogenase family enzyme